MYIENGTISARMFWIIMDIMDYMDIRIYPQ